MFSEKKCSPYQIQDKAKFHVEYKLSVFNQQKIAQESEDKESKKIKVKEVKKIAQESKERK